MKRKGTHKKSSSSSSHSHDEKTSSHTSKTQNKVLKDLSKNYWAISTVVLAIIAIVLLVLLLNNSSANSSSQMVVVSSDEAGQLVVDFAEAQGLEATLIGVEEESGLYRVDVTIQDQDVPVYITKDGESLVPSVIPLATLMNQVEQQANQQPVQTDIPKSDVPETELFVMTHCPYGTQAEKGLIPVIEAMGDDANIKIRFVHYTMHGEKEDVETIVQSCIREEQSEKYIPYLKEFLKEADTDAAKTAVGIDEDALQDCISSGRGDEYYAEDSALSEKYGVQGSPTLVINGVQASYGRNPQSYLSGVCDAYNEAPAVCSTELDTTNPSAGFGYGTGSATDAQC